MFTRGLYLYWIVSPTLQPSGSYSDATIYKHLKLSPQTKPTCIGVSLGSETCPHLMRCFLILLRNFDDNLSHNICLPRRLGDLGSAWRSTPPPVSVTRYLYILLSFSKKKQSLRHTVCICFFEIGLVEYLPH